MDDKLESLREEIDAIDQELLEALSKRFAVVAKIGRLKASQNKPVLDEKRWEQVLAKNRNKAIRLQIPLDFFEKLFSLIHQSALKTEKEAANT
jgi:chorismate mutase